MKNTYERMAGLAVALTCCFACLGAALGKWEAQSAFAAMLLLLLFATLYQVSRKFRPISEIFALAIVLGVAGCALMVITQSVAVGLIGAALAGLARWATSRIERKNWVYARK